MCLAVPARVESIDGDFAQVDFGGASKRVCVTLLPGLEVGEYVIVHTGYAIERMKPEEAKKTLALFEEMAQMEEDVASTNESDR
ncbi:MAG: HypC/HybG/HupF family hydrogenase formation chaperone [Candidatus Thorarchaeota archaeon]